MLADVLLHGDGPWLGAMQEDSKGPVLENDPRREEGTVRDCLHAPRVPPQRRLRGWGQVAGVEAADEDLRTAGPVVACEDVSSAGVLVHREGRDVPQLIPGAAETLWAFREHAELGTLGEELKVRIAAPPCLRAPGLNWNRHRGAAMVARSRLWHGNGPGSNWVTLTACD